LYPKKNREIGGKMKVTIEVELEQFHVPDYVQEIAQVGNREEGFKKPATYKISELDPDTLSKLCDAFRAGVFKKAGKSQPTQLACCCEK